MNTSLNLPMPKKRPECPQTNPLNCKEYNNPKTCAFVRRDKVCRERKKTAAKTGNNQKPAESTTTRTAGGLDFIAKGGKRQGREVPQSLRVKPGVKHPVWKTQSSVRSKLGKKGGKK
jgi:hypothetical protein